MLAVPTRRNILEILADKGQLTATAIGDKFNISHPAISQHLKILREANLVTMQKHTQKRIYQINPLGLEELEHWTKHIAALWHKRFNALEELLIRQQAEEKINHPRSH